MRTFVRTLLGADSVMNGLGITVEDIYQAESIDTPPSRPFLSLRWGIQASVGFGAHRPNDLTIAAHDEPGDYTRIDQLIIRIRELLLSIAAAATGDGGWISVVDYAGASGDLADDGYGTIKRDVSFRLIGSGR